MKRIVLTPGEPGGIGPDITICLAQQAWPVEIVVVADPDMLQYRATLLGLPLQVNPYDDTALPKPHEPGTLTLLPVALAGQAVPGKLNHRHAAYVIHTLEVAADLCQKKLASALVTGPVHKGSINAAGIPFTGHTEFLAHYCQVSRTVMLFVVNQLKVALATTHLPLADVPAAITKTLLQTTLSVLKEGLQSYFHLNNPRILICGLNPHAGEGGHLGREEIDIISPALAELRTRHYQLEGPLPADTLFTPRYLKRADAVLAMYHDQALPLVKYAGFGQAVNVTLGLPFLRTSVDHGTALDIAGTGQADPGSMIAAIRLAITLSTKQAL